MINRHEVGNSFDSPRRPGNRLPIKDGGMGSAAHRAGRGTSTTNNLPLPEETMTQRSWILLAITIVAIAVGSASAAQAGSAKLRQVGTIANPAGPIDEFDIGFVDQKNQRYYLADRSNKSVDIFDTKTGGESRVDEMAYDAKDGVVIGVNNAEEPPYATLVSTKPGHKILAKITFEDATDGAEQPAYDPADGMLYVAIPELKKDGKKGGVAVIDPRKGKLVKMLSVENCHPNGLVFGAGGNFVLGCTADGKEMPPIITVMSAKTGKLVKNVADIGGADMVAYNPKAGQYYTGSRNMPEGPVLGVIDAKTNVLAQKIALKGGNPHSVAVNQANNHVFVPQSSKGGGCGCVLVFAPE